MSACSHRLGRSAAFFALAAAAMLIAIASPAPVHAQPPDLSGLIADFEALRSRPDAERRKALRRFGEVKTDASARYVENVYRIDLDKEVRLEALTVLGTVASPHAQMVLGAEAAPGKDVRPRARALESLGGMRPLPLSRRVFLEALPPDQPAKVRVAAAGGLAAYADRAAADYLLATLVEPTRDLPASKLLKLRRYNQAVVAGLRKMDGDAAAEAIIERCLEQDSGRDTWRKAWLGSIVVRKRLFRRRSDLALRLAQEKDPGVRLIGAQALARVEPFEGAVEARLIALLKDKVDEVSAQAAAALMRRAPESGLKPLLRLAKHRSVLRAAAATAALAAYPKSDDAFAHFEKIVVKRRKPWRVVAAAIAALKGIRERRSIDVLVRALPKLNGRIRDDCRRALEELSGLPIGAEASDWTEWWKAVHDTFAVPPANAIDAHGRARTVSRGGPSYYGFEVISRRLCFVVDLSGSMKALVDVEDGPQITRIALAKRELVNVIRALPKDAYFNVVFFGTHFEAWRPTLTRATPAAKKAVIAHIAASTHLGETNIYDSVESAILDQDVDTVYLLSDGAPTAGKFVLSSDIRREVARINAGRRVVIHTISIGRDSTLMKKLAKANGGDYLKR